MFFILVDAPFISCLILIVCQKKVLDNGPQFVAEEMKDILVMY